MNKLSRVILIGVFLFTVSWGLTACKDKTEKVSEEASKEEVSEDLEVETREAMESAGEFLDEGQKEYQEAMAVELAGMDKMIEGLKIKSQAAENEKKAEYQAMIQELTEKRDAIQKKMEGLKEASGDTWQDIKNELDAAMEDLKKTYNETAAKFEH
jgi:hypothetical protein